MTTFEGLILLAAIIIMIIITNGVTLIVRKLNKIIDNQYAHLEILSSIHGDTVDIFQELSNIELSKLQEILNDLAINVRGNYYTLERQQEDIGYIRTYINKKGGVE